MRSHGGSSDPWKRGNFELKTKQKSLELSKCCFWLNNVIGLFFFKQKWFKAAWFSINIFVMVIHVPGWIYKSLQLMKAGPKTSRTAGKQELFIMAWTSLFCEGSTGWGTMESISTSRNYGQKMFFSIETSTTIRVETLFPVNCSPCRNSTCYQNYFCFQQPKT